MPFFLQRKIGKYGKVLQKHTWGWKFSGGKDYPDNKFLISVCWTTFLIHIKSWWSIQVCGKKLVNGISTRIGRRFFLRHNNTSKSEDLPKSKFFHASPMGKNSFKDILKNMCIADGKPGTGVMITSRGMVLEEQWHLYSWKPVTVMHPLRFVQGIATWGASNVTVTYKAG